MANTRLTLPKQIAVLEDAFSPAIKGPHQYVVEYPVEGGAQAALIISGTPKKPTWLDALVVLPGEVRGSTPIVKPQYASALALLTVHYKKEITLARTPFFMRDLVEQSWADDPFNRQVQGHIERKIEKLMHVSSSLPDENPIKQGLRELAAVLPEFGKWSPLHLRQNTIRDSSRKARWQLLVDWDEWDARGLDLEERAAAFYGRKATRRMVESLRDKLWCLSMPVPRTKMRRTIARHRMDATKVGGISR